MPHIPIASQVGCSQSFVAGSHIEVFIGVHSGMPVLLELIELELIELDVMPVDVEVPPPDPPLGRNESKS